MSKDSLYAALSTPVKTSLATDPGRTEHTATIETIDRDRHLVALRSQIGGDLFDHLSDPCAGAKDHGRTEGTEAGIETIDMDHGQDRVGGNRSRDDLYLALGSEVAGRDGDRGRTEITEATETIDWDKPPGTFLA